MRESIHDLLRNLRGLEPLKRLFWQELNYDRVNQPVPTRAWGEAERQMISGDPLLLAEHVEFKIVYLHMRAGLARDDQRALINRLLQAFPYVLFVFSDSAQQSWHFVNVKYERDPKRRRVFRRITVLAGSDQLRTATERLSMLDLDKINTTPQNLSPLKIQQLHDEAFDVEAVTNDFFREYKRVFALVEQSVKGLEGDTKRLFTQKLFNRLMFIIFLERKGWLKIGNRNDYLRALFNAHEKEKVTTPDANFYHDRLQLLFFAGLNNEQEINIIDIAPDKLLSDRIGNVPYLNGGLFVAEADDKDVTVSVPDESLRTVLDKLLYHFNFTVTESTPIDIEIAVDPEMLGKVFENLVTGRRDTGSYYTPKSIVSFMCRQTLKGYLGGYTQLIDDQNVASISVPTARSLIQRISSVKMADLACGSGAYLLGMLHELYTITKALDTRAQQSTAVDDYQRKLSIIQNNLYGVDIDPFAVNIARLRLWLSLVIEFDGPKPEPLPNLNFKIECGDSLTAPSPQEISTLFRFALVQQTDRLVELKALQFKKSGAEARRLESAIHQEESKLRDALADAPAPTGAFDWRVEFAEVFSKGGFDIILANPPYGARVADNIRDLYFNRRTEGAQSKDTYGLFIARGLQLLRTGGQFCYIVSDTWRTIKSHRPLRKRLLEDTTVAHVVDLPAWIFDATVNTCILTLTNTPAAAEHMLIAGDLRSVQRGDWTSLAANLLAIAEHGVDVQTLIYARYTYPQSMIRSYRNLSFFTASPYLYRVLAEWKNSLLEGIADVKVGLQTSDNEYYLRKRLGARGGYEISNEHEILTKEQLTNLTQEEKEKGVDPLQYGGRFLVPFDKGGDSETDEGWLPNYYVPTEYFID